MIRTSITRRRFLATTAVGAAGLWLRSSLSGATSPAPASSARLTMLNSMAGSDFEIVAQRHAALGLKWLDLKDGLWGETINNLSLEHARRARDIARAHGLGVFCFSTAICSSPLNDGEAAFRSRHSATLDHVLKVADILQPQYIRLISATLKPFPAQQQAMAVVEREYPWVFRCYGEMVDRIVNSGRRALIENETPDVIFERLDGILRFFERLDRSGRAHFTWDVQNLWQMGVFPTMAVYQQLKPLIGCIHLKGGRAEGPDQALVHASSLEEASWSVTEIVRAAVADGVAPFMCLNPSHGLKPPGFNVWEVVQRDIAFLRRNVSADL